MAEEAPRSLVKLHKKHIRGSKQGALVKEYTIHICSLTNAVSSGCSIPRAKVYATSRMLKHLYDKRPGSEYDFLIYHLPQIVKFADRVLRNSSAKRGSFIFVKQIEDTLYMASLEESEINGEYCLMVATAYHVEEIYLEKFSILWSWGDGSSPS